MLYIFLKVSDLPESEKVGLKKKKNNSTVDHIFVISNFIYSTKKITLLCTFRKSLDNMQRTIVWEKCLAMALTEKC